MLSFFKRPKPRGYKYKPMYYDPIEEERDGRRRSMEGASDPEAIKYRIKSGFSSSYSAESEQVRKRNIRRSNFRIVLIILTLLLAAYILVTRNFTSLVENFM